MSDVETEAGDVASEVQTEDEKVNEDGFTKIVVAMVVHGHGSDGST